MGVGRRPGRGRGVLALTAFATAAVVDLVVFQIGPTRQPVTTLFVLLIAGTLLVVALNR